MVKINAHLSFLNFFQISNQLVSWVRKRACIKLVVPLRGRGEKGGAEWEGRGGAGCLSRSFIRACPAVSRPPYTCWFTPLSSPLPSPLPSSSFPSPLSFLLSACLPPDNDFMPWIRLIQATRTWRKVCEADSSLQRSICVCVSEVQSDRKQFLFRFRSSEPSKLLTYANDCSVFLPMHKYLETAT